MLHAIIMAGGAGTRFWPESRAATPKQLLRLSGEKTMLQATVGRLEGLTPAARVRIITNIALVDPIRDQLPSLPKANVVGEPCKRDTAPCIGLAALIVSREDPDAIMAVMPADHVIQPAEQFRQSIQHAAKLLEEDGDRIVTIGIPPTYAAESFGYVERGEAIGDESAGGLKTYEVKRFREKPDAETARQYLENGRFFWNSGIFVWKAATILQALEQYQSEMFKRLVAIGDAMGTADEEAVLRDEFEAIQPVSIDYAVMEHAKKVVMIESPFKWDDVGSWQAMSRLLGTDADGNTIDAKHLGVNTTGSIIRGPRDHLIVSMGVKDCLIVHTPDATLVANKHDEEAVREVVRKLKEMGWDEYL